jgi:hypothetical protein
MGPRNLASTSVPAIPSGELLPYRKKLPYAAAALCAVLSALVVASAATAQTAAQLSGYGHADSLLNRRPMPEMGCKSLPAANLAATAIASLADVPVSSRA